PATSEPSRRRASRPAHLLPARGRRPPPVRRHEERGTEEPSDSPTGRNRPPVSPIPRTPHCPRNCLRDGYHAAVEESGRLEQVHAACAHRTVYALGLEANP